MAQRIHPATKTVKAAAASSMATVSLTEIRRFARKIAKLFQPDIIMLFGSYADGKPNADSDVDLLVVMATRNELDQAVRICEAVSAPFPFDLIVRKPEEWKWRIEERESFSTEILTRGKILYEKGDARVGEEGRLRLPRRARSRRSSQARS